MERGTKRNETKRNETEWWGFTRCATSVLEVEAWWFRFYSITESSFVERGSLEGDVIMTSFLINDPFDLIQSLQRLTPSFIQRLI
jgi:hypothetical protein